MKIKDFEVKGKETKYASRRWAIEATTVHTLDGQQKWEQLKAFAPAVVMVPVNDEGKIGLISQNRVLEDGSCRVVYEFPSGWMETDSLAVSHEDIEENANRELREEIGYRAKRLELLIQFRLGNFALVPFYVMVAKELEEDKLPSDEGEHINVEWLSLDDAEYKLLENQTPTAQVLIALQAYKSHIAKE